MASNKITDYYWTFTELADLIYTKCEYEEEKKEKKRIEKENKQNTSEKIVGKIERKKKKIKRGNTSYTERFSDICNKFGLNELFKHGDKKQSRLKKSDKNSSGGQYIFPKCMRCRIVFAINKRNTEISCDIEPEKFKKSILEDMDNADKKLFMCITDEDFNKYFIQKCPFIYPKEEDSEYCCEEFTSGRCVPYLLKELDECYGEYHGKKGVFSSLELEYLCGLFYNLLSICNNSGEYKKVVDYKLKKMGVMKKETKNSFISYSAAIYGREDDFRIKSCLEDIFRLFYVMQCTETEKAEELFMKLSNYNDLKRMSWRPEVLVMQVGRWRKKWVYIFKRFNNLRKIERNREDADMNVLEFDILMQLINWELSYENFDVNEIVDEYTDEFTVQDINEDHILCENTKIRKKGKKLIRDFLDESINEQEYLSKRDIGMLYEMAFVDLERVIDYISLGWKKPKGKDNFSENVVEILDDKYRKIRITNSENESK